MDASLCLLWMRHLEIGSDPFLVQAFLPVLPTERHNMEGQHHPQEKTPVCAT